MYIISRYLLDIRIFLLPNAGINPNISYQSGPTINLNYHA